MSTDHPTGPAQPPASPPAMATWVAAALAGLAALVWLLWTAAGDGVVQQVYDGRAPAAWMNGLIRWQALHPVAHYRARAGAAVSGAAQVLLVAAALLAAWDGLRRRALGSREGGPDEWQRRVWGAALTLTAALWLLLARQVPLLEALPYWFWPLHHTLLPLAWLAVPLGAALLALLAWLIRHDAAGARRGWRCAPPLVGLALVILLGYSWQLGVAAMEGRGWAALTERLTESHGHAELARAATRIQATRLLEEYEHLLATGELAAFPHATRPPGPLLFLNGLHRLSRAAGGDLPRLAALLLPLLSCLVAAPLYVLCRWMVPAGAGGTTLWLTVTAPSLTLVVLHLDQCLFPLLAWSCAAAWGAALQRQAATVLAATLATAAGALFYVALLGSFGLLALAPALAAFTAVHVTGRAAGGGLPCARLARARLARLAASAAAGFLAPHLVLWLGFGYDAAARLTRALAAHGAWKVSHWTAPLTAYLAGLNLLEFGLWCGPALAVLAGAEVTGLWRRRRRLTPADGAALALALTLAALALGGRTAGETARLWLFVLPLVAAAAASRLARIDPAARMRWIVLVGSWQLATTVFIKRFQDFL